MTALLVGYARCSTEQQDLTAQREGLLGLGVDPLRVYVDHGLTGTNRDRPGLREALAACREGDTLVVTKLDRLARSLPDARAIADELTARHVRLNLGGSVYDPNDAVGRLLFNVLAMVAEFESDLIRLRTREGMKIAKAKGRLRGKKPKLNARQEAHLMALFETGGHSTAELADLFSVGRSTVSAPSSDNAPRRRPHRPSPRHEAEALPRPGRDRHGVPHTRAGHRLPRPFLTPRSSPRVTAGGSACGTSYAGDFEDADPPVMDRSPHHTELVAPRINHACAVRAASTDARGPESHQTLGFGIDGRSGGWPEVEMKPIPAELGLHRLAPPGDLGTPGG